ncbi:hypothetical protein AB0H57_15690 [Micromonospora sp. NPDC050686]|uniref:hypothetical protein n=1 Tax=Micromonospora sp. NPDC050686 TaxID=3154631 RepID=UPI0033D047D8
MAAGRAAGGPDGWVRMRIALFVTCLADTLFPQACYDACPVKTNIPELLVHLRAEAPHPRAERAALAAAAYTMDHPALYAAAQRAARLSRLAGRRGRGLLHGPRNLHAVLVDQPG